jgi:hypothetical protein
VIECLDKATAEYPYLLDLMELFLSYCHPEILTVIPKFLLSSRTPTLEEEGSAVQLGPPERKQIPRAKIRRFGMTVSRGEVTRAEAVARQR